MGNVGEYLLYTGEPVEVLYSYEASFYKLFLIIVD